MIMTAFCLAELVIDANIHTSTRRASRLTSTQTFGVVLHDDCPLFLYKKEASNGKAHRTLPEDEPGKDNRFPPRIGRCEECTSNQVS